MKPLLLLFALTLLIPTNVQAQLLNEYQWKSRLILVFTHAPDDPMFVRQMKLLQEAQEDFAERNVVFIMISPEGMTKTAALLPGRHLQRPARRAGTPERYAARWYGAGTAIIRSPRFSVEGKQS